MKVVFRWKKRRNGVNLNMGHVYVNPISRSGGDCNGNLEMPGPSDTGSLECIWGVLYNKRDKNFEKKGYIDEKYTLFYRYFPQPLG